MAKAFALSDIPGLREAFPDEDACRWFLQMLRWPDGVECPRCEEHKRISYIKTRRKFHCHTCRYQFSVTAGTVFHNSHLPLSKWFLAVYLMVSNEKGVSANELHQILGGSYKTAWYLEHRIRAALAAPSAFSVIEHAPDMHTGEVWQKLEESVGETYHQLSLKHLPAYWSEMEWRALNAENPFVFRDTVLALVRGEALPYDELTS
jgi:transposase-like protein